MHVRHTSALAGWQHLALKVGADIGLLSSCNCPRAFEHEACGEDLDYLPQKLHENIELVQKARPGPGYDC